MRIGVDLDGVVYEWEKTARYMLREYRGLRHPTYGLHKASDSWDYIPRQVSPEDWYWLWHEGVDRGLFRYGHVTKGAILGLQALLGAGHDLLVVTHRPKAAVQDTLAWLAYLNIPWSEVHILSNGEPKSSVFAEVLIDDKPENVIEWRDSDRRALLFHRPWNASEEIEGVRRVYDWAEAADLLNVGE